MLTRLLTNGLNAARSTRINTSQAFFQHRPAYHRASQRVRLLCLLIALLAGLSPGRAQCPTGIVTLATQAQINAFATQYPTCTNLPAQLIISGPDIIDLSPLATIVRIDNSSLIIQNNPLLVSLTGLNSLTVVGSMQISDNASLTSLSGLDNLTATVTTRIENNAQLTSIAALSNVSSGASGLRIANNASLTSLNGLNKIPSGQSVAIINCPLITSLEGLTSLATISGSGPRIVVTGNTSLTSLSGLTSLTNVTPNVLVSFQDNPALSNCVIDAFCQRLTNGGQVTISNNAPGCNSRAEVLSACAGTDIGIVTQPPSQSTVLAGTSVSVPVSATGNITAYQWYKGNLNSPVAGQTSATLSLSNVTTSDAGTYSVVISSPSTSLTSTAFMLSVTTQPIRYVRAGGSGDGGSWATASEDLQAMINAEGTQQVWVAAGTYKPTSTTARDISFNMKNGVSILGGFSSSGDPDLTQRSPASFATILSGDIGVLSDNSDNSCHVINNLPGLTSTAVLDGFVITGGNAIGSETANSGGGLYNVDSSPSLTNCSFLNNTAISGGGLYNVGGSPSLLNCSFLTNTTYNIGDGGGLYNVGGSPSLANCSFQANMAYSGGGMYNYSGSPSLFNCSFSNNTASTSGGGMFNYISSPSLLNCSFLNNSAINGGGIGNFRFSPILTNCVVFGNGGAKTFYNGSAGFVTARFSLFEVGVTGYSIDPSNLTTVTSPFAGTATTQLAAGSPAINAGNSLSYTAAGGPPTDLAGNVRIQNGTIDMGAYEFSLPTDLTPLLFVSPSLAYSTTTGSVVVDVFEINSAPTSGTITVHISKSSLLSLSFDPSATSFVGKAVQNSVWSFDGTSNPNAYILTTTQAIGAGSKLSVGLSSLLTPGQTKGTISVTATLVGSSGGEVTMTNNTDADQLEYFSK